MSSLNGVPDPESGSGGVTKAAVIKAFIALGACLLASNYFANEWYLDRAKNASAESQRKTVKDIRAERKRILIRVEQNNYARALEACQRGNESSRAPFFRFLSAFIVDERLEPDDPELFAEAVDIRKVAGPVDCLTVVDKPEIRGAR